jgi:hypothetical protein
MNTCGQKTAVQIHLHFDLYFDAGDIGPHTSIFVCFVCVVIGQHSRIAINVMECISTAQQRDLDTGQGSHTNTCDLRQNIDPLASRQRRPVRQSSRAEELAHTITHQQLWVWLPEDDPSRQCQIYPSPCGPYLCVRAVGCC